jgi:hypothetical protein
MMSDVAVAANSWIMWGIAIVATVVVGVQAWLYIRLARRAAVRIGFPDEKCRKALRVGAIAAIGPSFAIFVVLVGMIAIIGTPMAWMRECVVGAAGTELAAATIGSESAGRTFGSAEYDLAALASSWWTMSINGVGWLLVVALFAHRLEFIRVRVGGGDAKWLGVLSAAALIGVFAALCADKGIVPAIEKPGEQLGLPAALLGAGVAMLLMNRFAQRWPWLREYSLGVAMILGVVAGAAVKAGMLRV